MTVATAAGARRAATAGARRPPRWHARVHDLDPHLVAALAPQSLAAEQYRSLRTRLKRAENGRALRTIVVTSPNKGDGKSLTAANLALTMAQEFQQRVLLVDARPAAAVACTGCSASPDGPGLADVLMGAAELDDALVALPEHHLTVLPAGLPAEPSGGAARVGGDAPRCSTRCARASTASSSTCRRSRRSPTCTSLAPMVDGC